MRIRELGSLRRADWPAEGEGSASQDLALKVFGAALDKGDATSQKTILERLDPAKQEIVYTNADVWATVAQMIGEAKTQGVISAEAASWFDQRIERHLGGHESGA